MKIKQFRLKGKKLFLTYPQLNSSIEFLKEEVLKQLKLKIKNIEHYLIGAEKQENDVVNIHCFFELKTTFDTLNINYLDLQFKGVEYHGNYQVGKIKKPLIEYIIKNNDYITNMILPVKNGKLLKPEEHLFFICEKDGLFVAEKYLYKYYPLLAAKRGSIIMDNLIKFNRFNFNNYLELKKKPIIKKSNRFILKFIINKKLNKKKYIKDIARMIIDKFNFFFKEKKLKNKIISYFIIEDKEVNNQLYFFYCELYQDVKEPFFNEILSRLNSNLETGLIIKGELVYLNWIIFDEKY